MQPEDKPQLAHTDVREPWQAIFHTLPVGILLLDCPQLVVTEANPAALHLLDVESRAALIGRSLAELLPGLIPTGVLERLHAIAATGGRYFIHEYEHYRGQRGIAYWGLEAALLPRSEAAPQMVLTIFDTTDTVIGKKNVEQHVSEVQERVVELEAIIAQMAEGVIVIDSIGRVLSINRQGKELLGINEIHIDTTSLARAWGLYHLDGTELADNDLPFIRAVRMGEIVKDAELLVRSPQAGERVISINGAPLVNTEGQIIGAVAAFHDISDRLQYQRILEQNNERLVEVDRLKTRFISTVSHELRTPLNAITGLVNLLQRDKGQPLTEAQLDIVARIAANTRNLMMLINDLLDYSRLASGKERLNLTRFSASELIEQVWVSLIDTAQTKGLTCTKEVQDIGIVESDFTKCHQVLINLLGNAIKYTQTGTVRLVVKSTDDQFWAVEVQDTGPGIPQDDLTMIFDEFNRSRNAEQGKVTGTGLGLPISRKMVELMGGTIAAESVLGQGSIFRVIWPREVSRFVSADIIAGRNL